ncbi:MAG: hypothetical protein JRC87_11715 [Deltaproteobacteria bacterium]|nr:hypothetical protein [Deltaproteobacteria bacterium]
MKIILSALLSIVIAASAVNAAPENGLLLSVFEPYIQKKASKLQASEYKKARHIFFGDLNGDNKKDGCIIYTLEGGPGGGNNYWFSMAVFLNSDNGYKLAADEKIGGKSGRRFTDSRIEDGIIILDTLFRRLDDAFCCPSLEGKVFYELIRDYNSKSKDTFVLDELNRLSE